MRGLNGPTNISKSPRENMKGSKRTQWRSRIQKGEGKQEVLGPFCGEGDSSEESWKEGTPVSFLSEDR